MIQFEDKNYDLKFNLKRITMIENIIKKPIMSVVQSGYITISDLSVTLSYGMIKEGADTYMDPKKALEIINQLLEGDGSYFELSEKLAEALERDCPFFFRAG